MNDLLTSLGRLGFTQYEARAYTALLQSPRITGYQLSKRSGIPQSKIYEVLDKLTQKELIVSVQDGGFAQYIPLDPRDAVSRYRAEYALALDLVDTELAHLYANDHEGAAYVLNLVGSESVLARARLMIRKAEKRIHLSLWPNVLSQLQSELTEAEARGVAIAMCVYGHAVARIGAVYEHAVDEGVAKNQGGQRVVLAIDKSEVLVAHFSDSREATGHWSKNMGFVEMAVDYIRHDIFGVRMVEDFGPLIVEKYGPSRELLRDPFARTYPVPSDADG